MPLRIWIQGFIYIINTLERHRQMDFYPLGMVAVLLSLGSPKGSILEFLVAARNCKLAWDKRVTIASGCLDSGDRHGFQR